MKNLKSLILLSILFVSFLFFSVLVLFLLYYYPKSIAYFTVHSNKYYVVPFHLHHTPNVPNYFRTIIRYFKQYGRFYRIRSLRILFSSYFRVIHFYSGILLFTIRIKKAPTLVFCYHTKIISCGVETLFHQSRWNY